MMMNKPVNKIEKLIEEFCPQGVEFRALGEVIKSLKTGLNPRKNFILNTDDAKNYYVTVRELGGIRIDFLDKTDKVNDEALGLINNRSNLEAGDILFSGTGTVGRTALIVENPKNWNIKEGVYTIKPDKNSIHSKFLLYYLNSIHAVGQYEKKIVGSPVISLPMKEFKKILIPIPPLTIQKEIVKILDNFTRLEAELEAELEARKKQYMYYREELLSFGDDVEFRTLGEVYKFKYGKGNTIPTVGGQYPVYGSNGVVGTHNEFNSENSPVIGHIGAYAGIVNWGHGKHYVTYNGVICKIIVDFVTPKYAYYQLLKQDFNSMAHSASQPFVSYDMLNKVLIPIPSLSKQKEIVAILDKFDVLVNDISAGLPSEIAARKKQYEYYRNQLLTFEPLEAQDAN